MRAVLIVIAGVFVGIVGSLVRLSALGTSIPDAKVVPLVAISLLGYVAFATVSTMRPTNAALFLLAVAVPDLILLGMLWTASNQAQLFSMAFLPAWQSLVFLPLAALLADGDSLGRAGRWKWGLLVMSFALVAQFTPRPWASSSLHQTISKSSLILLACGTLGMLWFGVQAILDSRRIERERDSPVP